MSGFFKKLFNRIVGKKEEALAPEVQEQQALPAPVPVVEVAPEPEPEAVVAPKAKSKEAPPSKAKVEQKKPAAKKVAPKTPAPKKPEPKKAEPKKAAPKKPEPKKPEPKKLQAKAAPVKVAPKAPAAKPTPKKPEPVTPPPKAKAPPPPPPVIEKPKPAPVPPPVVIKEPKPAPPPPVVIEKPRPAPPPAVVVPEPEPAVEPPPPPPPAPKPVPVVAEEPQRKGWFSRLKEGLSKSSKSITGSITAIFTKRKLDKETLQELEDTLIQADLGLAVSERIIAAVSHGRYDKEIDPEEVKQILASEVAKVLKPVEVPFSFGEEKPYVILVVGVNGSGKTTTIGKLGGIAAREGFKVKFAACDTFRAAAIEQLTVWGKRIGAETISRPQGADAAGLAYDAMNAAQEDGTDILFIDTAGRLHNKAYLMDELDKVVRVIKKYDDKAPHAVLLVLDATTGQNALAQAEAFTKVAGVTGLIMTKLDGTARGGILVAIAEKFKLPIHAIGVGETLDDLQPFDAEGFARAIAGLDEKT
jgi:fused signal recognition particle receptor